MPGQLFHSLERCSRRNSGRADTHDLGRGVKIKPRYPIWRGLVPHLGDAADGNHSTTGITRLEARNIRRVLPEPTISLGDHLKGSPKVVEVVDVL